MNAQLTPTRIIAAGAVALPALLLTKHVWSVYFKMAPAPRRHITEVDSIPDSLRDSTTIKNLVNARGHVSMDDSRFMNVDVPEDAKGLDDEALLAAFVRGFFGGRVFAPERALLRLARPDIVHYSAIDKSSLPPPIWDIERLEGDALPALHTVLFGGFQVGHVEISSCAAEKQPPSSIDFVFGSDMAQFSGVHRFTILHDGTPGTVQIYYAHQSCNPMVNKALKPDFIFPLHKLYAMWLFREGAAEVMRRVQAARR